MAAIFRLDQTAVKMDADRCPYWMILFEKDSAQRTCFPGHRPEAKGSGWKWTATDGSGRTAVVGSGRQWVASPVGCHTVGQNWNLRLEQADNLRSLPCPGLCHTAPCRKMQLCDDARCQCDNLGSFKKIAACKPHTILVMQHGMPSICLLASTPPPTKG